jgi:hypothetical protein
MLKVKQRAKPMLSFLSIALLTTLLGSCGTVIFSVRCPPLATYDKKFQAKAADELEKAGPNVQTMMTDYGKHRDACRAMLQ